MESASGSDRKPTVDEYKYYVATTAIRAEYDQKIQDLLGALDYRVFEDYNNTVHERVQVQDFRSGLSAADALTERQEDDLISAMCEVRMLGWAQWPSVLDNSPLGPSQWTEEQNAAYLKWSEQSQKACSNRAAAILTPAQLEQFTKWQQQCSDAQQRSDADK
jgi:hypothetical protein